MLYKKRLFVRGGGPRNLAKFNLISIYIVTGKQNKLFDYTMNVFDHVEKKTSQAPVTGGQ